MLLQLKKCTQGNPIEDYPPFCKRVCVKLRKIFPVKHSFHFDPFANHATPYAGSTSRDGECVHYAGSKKAPGSKLLQWRDNSPGRTSAEDAVRPAIQQGFKIEEIL